MMSLSIKYTGPLAPGGRRETNRILKEAWFEMGLLWHTTMMPRHFEPSAMHRYNYKPRTPRYLKRKLREHGHQNPLEFSGRSKLQAQFRRRITSTSKGVRVTMRAPTLSFRPHPSSPRMREELVRLTRGEIRRIKTELQKSVADKMKKSKRTVRRRIAA